MPRIAECPFPFEMDAYQEYHTNAEVSNEGFKHINLVVSMATKNRDLPNDFDRTFQTSKGRFSKRASAHLHKTYGVKLPEKILTELGNLANQYTVRNNVMYGFTQNFDWRAGQFGDHGSCFWGGNSGAKSMILAHGGCAIRLFNFKDEDPKRVDVRRYGVGRAWILPADTEYGKFPVVFNAYRQKEYSFEMRDFAVIVADYLNSKLAEDAEKYEVKRIKLYNNDSVGGLLYLNKNVYENGVLQTHPKMANNSGGFLVAPKSVCEHISEHDFGFDPDDFDDEDDYDERIYCPMCDELNYEDEMQWVRDYYGIRSGTHVCHHCIEDSDEIVRCTRCSEHPYVRDNYAYSVLTIEGHHSWWCQDCYEQWSASCDSCGEIFSVYTRERDGAHVEHLYDETTGERFCTACSQERFQCEHCHGVFNNDDKHTIDGKTTCADCYDELYDAFNEGGGFKIPQYSPLNMNLFRNPLDPDDNEDVEAFMEMVDRDAEEAMQDTPAINQGPTYQEYLDRYADHMEGIAVRRGYTWTTGPNTFRVGEINLQLELQPFVDGWTIQPTEVENGEEND